MIFFVFSLLFIKSWYLVVLSPGREHSLGVATSHRWCHTKLPDLGRRPPETGAEMVFGATRYSVAQLT